MKRFYLILGNSLAASVINNFVWFAVTFWVFLQTQSVIATSIMAGIFTLTIALSGFFLGSLVDRYRKKTTMLLSSLTSLILYALAAGVYLAAPPDSFSDPSNVYLWVFVVLTLVGAMAGNLRGITLSTLVTIMVPEENRDRANGLVGTANGVAFMAASIFSGLAVGFLGVPWMLGLAMGLMLVVIGHLVTLSVPDLPSGATKEADAAEASRGVDLRGTVRAIRLVPGLFGLIFFHTFNNFLGGIFMALMDAYGLLLVSVQMWGTLWGVLSLGFIFGGAIVATRGLGKNPLRMLLLANTAMWSICILFPLRASIVPVAVGMFIWLCLIPVVEAAEQTVLQKVVEPGRQGRVFGFAQSVEQAATPITAFLIGPIAQLFFIPYMTTGAGVETIGPWFGTGVDRGIALLFIVAGWIGLIVTLLAMRSRPYRLLSANYDTGQVLSAPASLDRRPSAG
jgi:DHA3 family multidrug efflux protein-like MFS transporter